MKNPVVRTVLIPSKAGLPSDPGRHAGRAQRGVLIPSKAGLPSDAVRAPAHDAAGLNPLESGSAFGLGAALP